ncbi:MAG: maleylpyruvate isomerase N-terminal domain-containing protein [Ktedonobacterales bacterium]|nr:maleylpyruvate isomerase N-terminal domain-containing protein [Ktedonobacterales bacterium]
MADQDITHRMREQRLRTLALADQISEDRWREPALPGGRTLHDQLTHLLAWDEWAVAVFEISALRALPPSLVHALQESDDYNARTEERYRRLSRDDILSALQGAIDRVILSAVRSASDGQPWEERHIAELAGVRITAESGSATSDISGPSVGEILLHLLEHESAHAEEISAAFGIEPHLERFTGGEGRQPPPV